MVSVQNGEDARGVDEAAAGVDIVPGFLPAAVREEHGMAEAAARDEVVDGAIEQCAADESVEHVEHVSA